jgi:pilus assembly protein TadC
MSLLTIIIINTIILMGLSLSYNSYKSKKVKAQQANSWPEVLDLIISSLQSGASISESLTTVGKDLFLSDISSKLFLRRYQMEKGLILH